MAKINRNPNTWYIPRGTSNTERNARSAGEVTDSRRDALTQAKIERKADKTEAHTRADVFAGMTAEDRIKANIAARKRNEIRI